VFGAPAAGNRLASNNHKYRVPRSRRLGACATALVLALTVGQAGCSQGDSSPDRGAAVAPKAVRVAPVANNERARVFSLTGTTRAASRARLAFQVSGQLAERPVRIGSEVASNDLIARLSQPELRPAATAAKADVRQLSTQFAQAKRDLARVEKLVAQDAATRQELENTQARRDSLAAQLASAQARSDRAQNSADELRLTAPIAGTVEQVFFEPGEFVPAGQPVVALSGKQSLEVEIGVPESLLAEVSTGDAAVLTLPFFDGREIQGTVSQLARAAAGPGQLFAAVITLEPDAELRAGLSVNWRIAAQPKPSLVVPATAVASPGGTDAPRVYRVRDGVATAVAVQPGEIVGENVLVSGDLQVGDNVVTVGLNNLSSGRQVRVLDD
jgi:RND family efflux transporter MFP subunit